MYTEEQLNVGILLKALFEKYVTGNNSYTIHPTWLEISDTTLLSAIAASGFITFNQSTITLTELGAGKLTRLFSPSHSIPVEKVVSQLYEDAENILKCFAISETNVLNTFKNLNDEVTGT